VNEGRRAQRPTRTAFGGGVSGRRGYVTIGLILINVVMLLVSLASAKNGAHALGGQGVGGLIGGDTPLLDKLGVIGQARLEPSNVVIPYGVADGQYYRLFTAMFMHFGILHLLMNMYALWVLGRTLESFLGPLRFLALYLLAGIGGNVAAYVFQPGALSAGASTALFGMFAALFLVLRKLQLNAASVLPVIVINLIFTLSVPGISIAGHLGGFVVGAVAGAGLAYAPRQWRGLSRSVIQTAALVLILIALGGLTAWQTGQLAV
jgi:membrane associated rhomboid family serine protease